MGQRQFCSALSDASIIAWATIRGLGLAGSGFPAQCYCSSTVTAISVPLNCFSFWVRN